MNNSRVFAVIFLCSFSSLAYEVTLTRIFSVSLWYHFAFMIISIAMLGIGVSGTALSLFPGLRKIKNLTMYALLFGISISLSYLLANQIPFDPVELSWSKMQFLNIGLYYVILAVPFFFAGLVIATALSLISGKSALLYGADLLGAGAGSMGVLCLMTLAGPEKIVSFIALAPLFASLMVGGRRLKILVVAVILLTISLLLVHPPFSTLRMSPYKGLQAALRYPGAEHLKTYVSPFSTIDTFKSPAVRVAPGLSLRYLDALPEQIGFSIDGGEINAITPTADRASLAFLEWLPSALPYEIAPREDVLVLDPRGGLQVLVAQRFGTRNIYKVESNPLLLKTIRNDFADLSGGLYRSNTWSGLGRSWLRTNDKRFDVIDLSLIGAAASGSFGIAEDYRFTVDALKEYLGHLKPDGLLAVSLYIIPPPRTELRLTGSIVAALQELGRKDYDCHIAAIRSWATVCILAKNSPFVPAEIETIKKFSRDRRFDLIYYPRIKEEETNIYVRMPSYEYFEAFRKVLDSKTRETFLNNYVFDIRPVRDDNPFFHYYLTLRNLKDTYRTMGEKWQFFVEEGSLLPAVFVQVLLLSIILILLPAVTKKKPKTAFPVGKPLSSARSFLFYFALLGVGFMCVEISLIQKIILPLENPSYAVATILTSILFSSGAGSLLSHRISGLKSPISPLVLSFLIVIYSILFQLLSNAISPYPMAAKIVAVFFITLPLGLLMGIPFPLGLTLLGRRNEAYIPWAWAINACLSVLAPILTIMLAMVMGFTKVLWLGAFAYLMAFAMLRRFMKGDAVTELRDNEAARV